jgi:hypothetical protein
MVELRLPPLLLLLVFGAWRSIRHSALTLQRYAWPQVIEEEELAPEDPVGVVCQKSKATGYLRSSVAL